jgi:glycolate oxidase
MVNQDYITGLRALLGERRLSTAPEDMVAYSYDANVEARHLPDAVAFPEPVDEVSAILRLSTRHGVPVTPRGGGSGYTGGALPVAGGLVLAMDRFNRILEIDTDNFLAVVEPGVVTKDFQDAVDQHGLMYPPDPASAAFATIGGNIAENAGGIRAVKYGVTKDYVMGLEVVLPSGEIIRTGSKCIKDVVGYNITELFVGSEGTLGVITKAVLKVVPKPEARRTMTATFETIDAAAVAVKAVYGAGVRPATLEFLDRNCLEAADRAVRFGVAENEGAMLLFEVDGPPVQLDLEASRIREACGRCGVITYREASSDEDRESLWAARRALSFAVCEIADDWVDDDVSVPMSRIPDMIRKIDEVARKHRLLQAHFGHFGDGNIHLSLACGDKSRPFPREARDEIARAVVEFEGRIAAEHGIGCVKADRLSWNLSRDTMDFMRNIKAMVDPGNILNPHKIFPSEEER